MIKIEIIIEEVGTSTLLEAHFVSNGSTDRERRISDRLQIQVRETTKWMVLGREDPKPDAEPKQDVPSAS